MNTATFIYKKKDKLWFLNLEDALGQENKLKKQGWEHISTIDPAIMLANIYDVCKEDFSSDEKVKDIISLLMSS